MVNHLDIQTFNQIKFGERAFMHLHLWNPENRRKGIGSELVQKIITLVL